MLNITVWFRHTKFSEEGFASISNVEDANSTLTNRSVYKTTRRHIRGDRKNISSCLKIGGL